MLDSDAYILVGIAAVFIILGIAAVVWGVREEKGYYNALSTRGGDIREFIDHWPPRAQPGALKIGGLISLAVGIILLIIGSAIYIWG